MSKHVTRYSESFKAQVVRELSEGRFANVHAAARFYGIPGSGTVKNWVKRLGREDLVPKVVRMETPDEQNELKRLQKRVRELEQVLANKEIQSVVQESFLEIAVERAGVKDVETFKKKVAASVRGGPSPGTSSSKGEPGGP
jgi:transposase-like protein